MKSRIDNIMQRVKIAGAIIAGRTLVQYTGLDEDVRDQVELLHPYGWVAMPTPGSDAIEFQVGANGSHKVVLGGDNTANTLADLLAGEAGGSAGGQQIMMRATGIELVSALLKWGPARTALKRLVQEEFVALFNGHTHSGVATGDGNTGAPTTLMTAAHLTGGS
jgi:hypothetical protein